MSVLAPLNDPGALPKMLDAGVREIYVGFHDAAWEARFGSAELNRMSGFGAEANPFSFDEMRANIGRAAGLGMDAFVCFNAPAYAPEQLEFIADRYLARISDAGASGIILSGEGLIDEALAQRLSPVISTVAGVFNERLAEYYHERGAARLILPRDLSLAEIEGIASAVPGVEYEVFLMRNGCMFSDSHCLGRHRAGKPSLCTSLRTGSWTLAEHPEPQSDEGGARCDGNANADKHFLERARENERTLNERYHRRTCGLCALWHFEKLGIAAYKVVGRGDDPADLVHDAGLVARNAELARSCESHGEYLAAMEPPRDPETLCGMNGLSCYYPDVAQFWDHARMS